LASVWNLSVTKFQLKVSVCISNTTVNNWGSEWLMLNAKWAIFLLFHCENKLHCRWDDDDGVECILVLPQLDSNSANSLQQSADN
jgi:hypothetical protein